MKLYDKKIVLENGKEFYGYGFGADKEAVNELVFNTAMIGYQEIISDPSYTDQMVCMTYPLIGNYGITDEDFETRIPTMGGLIVREYNDLPSNFRYTKTLSEVLDEYGIPAISGVDTRKITRIIRDEGAQKVLICDADVPYEEALKKVKDYVIPTDMVSRVSCKKRWYSRTPNHKYDVVAIDCGISNSIIRELNEKSCNVTVVPYNVTADEILKMKPDGILLSSGPGNPEELQSLIAVVRELKGQFPMFGIGLGHQIIALAMGAKTYKMKLGHRGGNNPVVDLSSGKIIIVSQNHSYAVDAKSIEGTELTLTYKNVLDDTVEGISFLENKLFSVQFIPESETGSKKSKSLYDDFIDLMEKEAK